MTTPLRPNTTSSSVTGHRGKRLAKRRLTLETLESRNLLAATLDWPATVAGGLGAGDPGTGADVPAVAPAPPQNAVAAEPIMITSIDLTIDGVATTLTSCEQLVVVRPGAELRVTGIRYAVNPQAQGLTEVVAMEGYLRKTDAGGNRSFDYTDGRFGDPEGDSQLSPGNHAHSGLAGGWIVQEGNDRLSLALVRYFENEAVTESRFFVNLQVGQPDATFQKPKVKAVGGYRAKVEHAVKFKGSWSNIGSGVMRNYAELDVYRASDLTTPIWVGTLSGVVGAGRTVRGEFRNDNPNDAFAERWQPEDDGLYIVRVYADPEDVARELNEANNRVEFTMRVGKESRHDKLPPLNKDDKWDDIGDKKEKKDHQEKDSHKEHDTLSQDPLSEQDNGDVMESLLTGLDGGSTKRVGKTSLLDQFFSGPDSLDYLTSPDWATL